MREERGRAEIEDKYGLTECRRTSWMGLRAGFT